MKRLFPFAVLPFLAAMSSGPPEGEYTPYVRTEVPAARTDERTPDTTESETLRVLSAAEVEPSEFMWQARPVVIFADSRADPAFADQLQALERDQAPLLARDVVVITDTDPEAPSTWRRQLRPEGFSLVLMDKDGQVKQRKPSIWSVREITRAIDKFPLRLQEIGRGGR